MMILILLGLAIGVLSSVSGLGGGFLAVPLLIYLGKEAKMAVGTSFVLIILVAISSLAGHWRMGNIDIKTGLLLAGGGVLGALAGPYILQMLPEHIFKRVFAVFLMATAVWMMWNSKGNV
jgi:uncharacterized membrane protein YfcA